MAVLVAITSKLRLLTDCSVQLMAWDLRMHQRVTSPRGVLRCVGARVRIHSEGPY